MATKTKDRKNKKEPLPCTIDPNLFSAWQKLKRAKDAEKIAEKYGWSRPPIDNALNHGHVKQDEIVGQINEYFKERLKLEGAAGIELLDLQKQAKAIKAEHEKD